MARHSKKRKNRKKRVITEWKGPTDKFLSESKNKKGRVRIWLGKGHPYANSGGWQYKNRYMVMVNIGRKLYSEEEVHHINSIIDDDRLDNFEILLKENHGRFHGRINHLMQWRSDLGTFLEIDEIENRDTFDDVESYSFDQDSLEDIPF